MDSILDPTLGLSLLETRGSYCSLPAPAPPTTTGIPTRLLPILCRTARKYPSACALTLMLTELAGNRYFILRGWDHPADGEFPGAGYYTKTPLCFASPKLCSCASTRSSTRCVSNEPGQYSLPPGIHDMTSHGHSPDPGFCKWQMDCSGLQWTAGRDHLQEAIIQADSIISEGPVSPRASNPGLLVDGHHRSSPSLRNTLISQ
jgi:hypothetical protein